MTRTPSDSLIYLTLSEHPLPTEDTWEDSPKKRHLIGEAEIENASQWRDISMRPGYCVVVRGSAVKLEIQGKRGRQRRETLQTRGLGTVIADMSGWLESSTIELREEREQNEKRAAKQQEDFFKLLAAQADPSGGKTS